MTTSVMNIDCIMPAAGLSTRMGEWKLVLPYQNATIIEASVNHALTFCTRVILIVGYRSNELIELMGKYPNVDIVFNENYKQGMLSSIQLGVKHVRSDYFFVAHADMPCISPEIYQKLWQARCSGAIFPGNIEKSGHPVLIESALKEAILSSLSARSMKAILKNFPMTYLQLTDGRIHFDVDTPTAYQALQAFSGE